MPYEIRKNGSEYCVYKESGGDALGCHPTRAQAQAQIAAIYASESKSLDDSSILRYAIIITSNAYQDREGEIVRQKALEAYVDEQWRNDEFIGDQPLLVWHGGEPVGDVVYAEMQGPFLIEVAKERPDAPVNLAKRKGDAPIIGTVKQVWDALEAATDLGASHEFLYAAKDREDGVYEKIVKTETTVLPRENAANGYTFFSVVTPSGERNRND